MVIYPLNPLFKTVAISPQCPYSPYNQPGISLELSLRTALVVRHRLFPPMESDGEILVSSLGHSKVSTLHTVKENE